MGSTVAELQNESLGVVTGMPLCTRCRALTLLSVHPAVGVSVLRPTVDSIGPGRARSFSRCRGCVAEPSLVGKRLVIQCNSNALFADILQRAHGSLASKSTSILDNVGDGHP